MEKRSSFAQALFSGSEWYWETPAFSLADQTQNSQQDCLVLFISDFKQGTENGFNPESWEMFERIMKGMKLEGQEAVVAFDIKQAINMWRPKIIVLLGTTAASNVLGEQIRMGQHHGQFFERENFACPLVPIFHPDIMFANASLKAPAWVDIQKVMKFIGKL